MFARILSSPAEVCLELRNEGVKMVVGYTERRSGESFSEVLNNMGQTLKKWTRVKR